MEWGRFPFGQPNTRRPMRLPDGPAAALIVGVYPSAFHIAWTPPPAMDPRVDGRNRPYIGSLAVDVEPVVFWNGTEPAPATVLVKWKEAVGFDAAKQGTATVGTNGPSGTGLIEDFLTPLGIDPSQVAFTDAVPWFFVKHGARSQGEAVTSRFTPLAEQLDAHPGTIPPRPSAKRLVAIAGGDERRWSLEQELLRANAPLIITLGQEALDAVRTIAEVVGVQSKLGPVGYGQVGEVALDGRRMALMPLAHPGFVRQVRDNAWREALGRWRAAPGL